MSPYVTSTTYTARQLNNAFAKQTRIALQDLRNQINAQIDLLHQNGQPTTQQLAEFNQGVKGAVIASVYRLSSQAALLPGSSTCLIPGLQDALLSGSGIPGFGPTLTRPSSVAHQGRLLSRIEAHFVLFC